MLLPKKLLVQEEEMLNKELKELEKQGQDVDVVLLQEELLGEEQQEKLLVEEEQQEDDADLFLFFFSLNNKGAKRPCNCSNRQLIALNEIIAYYNVNCFVE